jgi:hypothetical protein
MDTTPGIKKLMEALANMSKIADQEKPLFPPQETQARILVDSLAELLKPLKKEIGTLLVKKKGVASAYRDVDGQLYIISRVFDPPLEAADVEPGSTHFGRIYDIAVLEVNLELGPTEFCVDSRFFTEYTGKTA